MGKESGKLTKQYIMASEETKKEVSGLADAGLHLLMDEISISSAQAAIEWILEANFKNTENKHKELNLVVCSPGGDLAAAFALIDIMKGSAIPVKTTGLGLIASAGLLIFISGIPGKRILTPNTSILSHQFTWGTYGKEHELFAAQKEFDLTTTRMLKHYKKCTGLTEKKIRKYLLPPQDIWLYAIEAKELGICDHIKEIK